jgi:lipopolysaccharide export system permease protein
MTRIDWVILRIIGSRILFTALIFMGLVLLVETIDSWRYNYLASIGGVPLALFGMVSAAADWLFKALGLVVLLGTAIGVVDLQSRRELLVIKSSGLSIWRVLRAPTVALLVTGLAVTLFAESAVTQTNRSLEASLPGDNSVLNSVGGLWLEQYDNGARYVIEAEHVVANGQELHDVSIFLPDGVKQGRILAPAAKLGDGEWLFPEATRYRAGLVPEHMFNFSLPTTTTAGDLRLKLSTTADMTFYELAASLRTRVTDPALRNAVATRFLRLLALPGLLVGALFIAFAFTAGYRRTSTYGAPVVYAIFLGFVIFVVGEMGDRAGSAGVIDPLFAALGPAFFALLLGLTALLYKEDGWA